MINKKTIYILGSGIGGLSIAHELSKHENYEIHIIEKENFIGGQSAAMKKNNEHTEYCWHALASGYVNLPQIMSEIPTTEGKFVIDNLKPIEKYFYITEKGKHVEYNKNFLSGSTFGFIKSLQKFTGLWHIKDMFLTFWKFNFIHLLSEERLESYDDISWNNYCSGLSKELKRWIIDSTSIYLGMVYNKINAQLMIDLLRHNQLSTYLDPKYDFYSFNNSINTVWFEPWKIHLQNKNVKFHMNTEIIKIKSKFNNINKIITKDLWNHTKKIFKPDIVINSLSVESLAYLYPLKNNKFYNLSLLGHQIQTQVLYYLDYRINEFKNTVYIFPDSPWFLMSRHEGNLWNLENNDLLSTGIGIWDVKGYNGKTALECSEEELAEECWNQMQKFQPPFNAKFPRWNIWNNFDYSKDKNKIYTKNPKFSNNVGTLKLRPKTKDEIYNNLYHSTAYTRTGMNIFNMDSAAEAGIRAAIEISGDSKKHTLNKVQKSNIIVSFIRLIDGLFFKYIW